jgi:hypothetical protein
MTRLVRILAAAAVLAIAVPAAASGCDDARRAPVPRPVPVRTVQHERWEERSDHRQTWRARELQELRREYRTLDAERAAFHARWAGRPGKIRKYDREYATARAGLDARWQELTTPAYAARW